MLKSYSYCEADYTNTEIHDDIFFIKEKNIAQRFVDKSVEKRRTKLLINKCPICGCIDIMYFYTKWNIPYLRCNQCYSIFAQCNEEIIYEYKHYTELTEYRKSDEYQKNATNTRMEEWKEFLQWIGIRTYRYCNTNQNFRIIDIGNRHYGFVQMIKKSPLCGKYVLVDSILDEKINKKVIEGDIVFYLNCMQKEIRPREKLMEIKNYLKEGGFLVIQTRAGSGFDILALQSQNEKIYPFEHVMLPTVEGLVYLLKDVGFNVLEITTPGVLDIQYAKRNVAKINENDTFARYLIERGDNTTLQEFQRFLQKNGLSSFVQVIAQKKDNNGSSRW